MKLSGPYTDQEADEQYHFTGRVFISGDQFLNEKTEVVVLEEGDVLRFFSSGHWTGTSWFALFKKNP